MIIEIEGWETFKYSRVFKIIEYRNSCVYKTKDTGKVILSGEKGQ